MPIFTSLYFNNIIVMCDSVPLWCGVEECKVRLTDWYGWTAVFETWIIVWTNVRPSDNEHLLVNLLSTEKIAAIDYKIVDAFVTGCYAEMSIDVCGRKCLWLDIDVRLH